MARQVVLLQVLVVLVTVLASLGLAAWDARRDARTTATARALAVARTLADDPALAAALRTPEPSTEIQPLAEAVRRDAGVDFITVMSVDRIRYSHPDPANIGRRFVGDVGDAPRGGVLTQQYAGTLGPSMRAVVPVRADARAGTGDVVALVAVGITLERIDRALRDDLLPVGLAGLAVLAVGLTGSWLVGRRLRRQTHGMGEREITRMYEYYAAVLHAVREGLVLLDGDGVVQLVNDEARRLLTLPDDVVGRRFDSLGLPPDLVATSRGEERAEDEVHVVGERVLVASASPAHWDGREVGSVLTLRDRTDLQVVTGELDAVRGLTESLRSQNHEAANRLHTVVSLIEMGRSEEAVDFATEELQVAQLLADRMVAAVDEPVVAALLLGKTAEAAERGIDLTLTGSFGDRRGVPARDLVTVLGNLVDNALDAVSGRPVRRVVVDLAGAEDHLRITVGDSGPGLAADAAEHALERGWSTKSDSGLPGGRGIGLTLVGQVARRTGGTVEMGVSPLGGAELTVVLRPSPTAAATS